MESIFPPDSDLDFSFTSIESDRTAISSTRTSISCSEFPPPTGIRRPHSRHDPAWSAVETVRLHDGALGLGHLKLIRHLGSGDIGRVFLCELKGFARASFALKVIDREAIAMRNKSKLQNVQMEAHVLSKFDHPFLPTLYSHFDVSHYTCFLIDYCPGGDLHSLLKKQPENRFPVDTVQFYGAEVLLGLEYLHSLGVVYRDLKPENVLRREDGHMMLSDFDLCFTSEVVPMLEQRFNKTQPTKKRGCGLKSIFRRGKRPKMVEELPEFVAEPTEARSRAFVGTHEYLAPEIISGKGHGNAVDWWAFGVFLYELLYGRTPFKGHNKESTLLNILSQPLRFPESGHGDMFNDTPEMVAARDLISKLLIKDPRRRLGSTRGAADIKKHPFFKCVKWPLMRSYVPPKVHESRRPMSQPAGIAKSNAGVRWALKKSAAKEGRKWA